MEHLYQSDLLRALGWAIADSIWKMSALWLAFQLLVMLPFRNRPVIRHAGALVTLVAGTLFFFIDVVNGLGRIPASGNDSYHVAIAPSGNLTDNITASLEIMLPYLSSAYLLVLVLLGIRLAWQMLNARKLKLEILPAREWQDMVDQLVVRMGLDREVFVYFSQHLNVPATIGFIKPVILLPLASVNQLSVEQVEAVLIHELAHIRRHDYLVNLLVSVISSILFFNPFVHLLVRTIRKECELCCDDAVLRQQQDPTDYVQALLKLEKARVRPTLAMAATGKQGLLLGRVKRMLNIPEEKVKYRHKLGALAAAAGLIMLTGLLTPVETAKHDDASGAKPIAAKTGSALITASPSGIGPVHIKDRSGSVTRMKIATNEALPAEVKPLPGRSAVPPVPAAPPPPPAPVADQPLPVDFPVFDESDVVVSVKEAPDPRDRRHPAILYQTDLAAHPEIMELFREKQPDLSEFFRIQNSNIKGQAIMGELPRILSEKDVQDLIQMNEGLIRISKGHNLDGKALKELEHAEMKRVNQSMEKIRPAMQPLMKSVKKAEGSKVKEGKITRTLETPDVRITIVQEDDQVRIVVNDKH